MTDPNAPVLVLVLGHEKANLPIVRSFGRQRVPVTLATVQPGCIAGKSRYVRKQMLMPDPTKDVRRWIDWLKSELKQREYQAVLPVGDNTVIPLHYHREEFAGSPPLMLIGPREYELSFDKENTVRACVQHGVPVPRTAFVHNASDVDDALKMFENKFPLMVKPTTSKQLVDNQIFYLPPIKTVDEASYRRATDYFLRYGRVLVQEMRRGHSELDEGFLLKDGSVVCELMNIWAPNPCGTRPASYRMSAKMEPRMREWSLKLLQSVSWTGVVEMEFFEDIEAGPMLMEINGRFWGGLPAADASGVDFPWLWLQVVTGRETPPKKSYPSPLYARNLERDLPWMVNNLRMPKTDPQRVSARRLLPEIGHVLAGRDRFDEFTRDDTAPGWFLLRWWTRQAARKLRFALLKTALCNRRYAKRAAKLAHNAERIFIISCNNIYRPPFLAELLSQEAKAAGIKLPPIFPRALFNNEGSSTPNEAVENAQTFGVSLTERRSTFLNEAPLSRRDVVILFEKWHVDELRELDKHGRAKIIFFELLCDSPRGARIPDPMWGGADALGIAYKLIARAAHRLVMQLAELPRA